MAEEKRVALVTGAASGLGAAVAKGLAQRGVDVVILDVREPSHAAEVVAACQGFGVRAMALEADVAQDSDCRRVAETALAEFGRIDILVNSAGTTKYVLHDDLEGLSAEDFQRIYAVNTIGPFQMIRACAPAMKRQGLGAVVNVSSLAGIVGNGSSIAYAASKGALITMTKSLARALAPEIRVNAVCPGFMATPWFDQHFTPQRAAIIKQQGGAMTPTQESGAPELIADAVLFLCLEGARYTTGETLLSDGGLHLVAGQGRA